MLRNKDLPKQTLTYDTTFDLMDNVLLSVLTYRQVELKQKPVVPLAYLFHDRKKEENHKVFFKAIVKELPELNNNKDICIATDDEKAIVNSVTKYMPNLKWFRCWIHAFRNLKQFCKKSGITSKKELKIIKQQFMFLLMADSKDAYNDAKIDIFMEWPKVVVDYYRKCLEPDIESMANWTAKEFGFELVSTNAAESHNAVIKRKNYDNLPMRLDDMVLSCLRNVQLTGNKILRSLYRVGGDYALLDQLFERYQTKNCPMLQEITTKQIKDRRIEAREQSEKYHRSTPAKPKYTYKPTSTAIERALEIIEQRRLTQTPEQKCWAVTGSTGQVYTVVLFQNGTWNPHCSCANSAICCHIMAVLESVGCNRTASSRIPVVLDMMQNKRMRNDKKLGGKASLKDPGDQRKKKKCEADDLTETQEDLLAEENELLNHEKGYTVSNSGSPSPFTPSSVKKATSVSQPVIHLPSLNKRIPVILMTAYPKQTEFVNPARRSPILLIPEKV